MKCMSTAIITHGNSSPVLEPSKHDFNFVPLFIESPVIKKWLFPVLFGWNTWRNTFIKQCVTKPASIITTICQKLMSLGEVIHKHFGSLVITHLTFCKYKSKRLSLSIAKGMEFCVQSTFCTPDTPGKSPFFNKLTAVLCALRCVASIITRPSSFASFASSVKILLKIPILLQRIKRL